MSGDWTRPEWQATEGIASLFFFIPGPSPTGELKLSQSRHHVDGFPEELEVSAQERSASPEWFEGFFAQPGMGYDLESAFRDQVDAVRNVQQATVVRGDFVDPDSLDYLRNTIGVVSAILEQGGLGVLDVSAARWWTRAEWLSTFVEENDFAIEDFVRIVVSDDELLQPGLWAHTRGMRKFGRPDLQIKHIPGPWQEDSLIIGAAGNLLNSLAEQLARGMILLDGETMAFPGIEAQCTLIASPDDTESPECHFGNEALELVDVIDDEPGEDLNRLLTEIAESE